MSLCETEGPDLRYDFDLPCSPRTQFSFFTANPVSFIPFPYIYFIYVYLLILEGAREREKKKKREIMTYCSWPTPYPWWLFIFALWHPLSENLIGEFQYFQHKLSAFCCVALHKKHQFLPLHPRASLIGYLQCWVTQTLWSVTFAP